MLTNVGRYEHTEALWGVEVSPGTISELNKKATEAAAKGLPTSADIIIGTLILIFKTVSFVLYN